MEIMSKHPDAHLTDAYLPDEVTDHRRDQAIAWFWLSVLSLLAAGVFSVLLVLARTPFINAHIPFVDFFHTALVIHVDLSVLVWILSFAGVLWSMVAAPRFRKLNKLIFFSIVLATLLICASAFVPEAKPLMSNYIPVLDNWIFLSGLILFGIGVSAQVLTTMTIMPPIGRLMTRQGALRFGLNCAAISVLMTIGAFFWSWLEVPAQMGRQLYFELVFWGGGHILQYTYTLLMMVCWLWLASLADIKIMMSERIVLLIFLAGLISVFIAPLIYYHYPVMDPQHRSMFTWLMSFGGSLATFPLGLAMYYGLLTSKVPTEKGKVAQAALMSSLLLFGCGGLIGFLIDGSNVTIPAHYHGCIVGVTLALMGVAYDVLPRLGFSAVNYKWARIQLWTYAVGQFIHILGLVWSGGYGVQRKVAGAAQDLDTWERVAGMGLMGFGGLISAIGGLIFVILTLKVLTKNKQGKSPVALT